MLETSGRTFRLDVLGELHLPLERAVLDLHLLVDASRSLRPRPLTCDDEQPLARDDAHALRVDAGQFDDHGQSVRIVGVKAVDVRSEAEAVTRSRETRDVPQVGEQLLDLRLQLVDVPSTHPENVPPGAVRRALEDRAMSVIEPRFAAWSYLLYTGAFVLLGAAAVLLAYLSGRHAAGAYALFSFLVLLGFAASALALQRSGSHPVTAGLLAYAGVTLFGAFVLALWSWFGWLSTSSLSFGGFHVARLAFFALTLLAALAALRRFRFPLLMLTVVLLVWLFVVDLVSGGGDWSAVVTFALGLCFLAAAVAVDGGPNRPYGFWLHVGSGLTIGGSLLWFLHHGHFQWVLIAVAGLIYVKLADLLERSSWAVFGSLGILAAATHFASSYSHTQISPAIASERGSGSRGWVPAVVFGLAGTLLLVLGGLLARRADSARRRL